MYKKYLISKSANLLAAYKKYKNKLTSLIRLAEKNYFADKLFQVKDNMAKTWKILNTMTDRSKTAKDIVQIEKKWCANR